MDYVGYPPDERASGGEPTVETCRRGVADLTFSKQILQEILEKKL